MVKSQLIKLVTVALNRTKNCAFKRAFIPKGYACVSIKDFAKGLAEQLGEKK